jgi:solute carrier family 25 phosphate transporter 3
MGDQTDLKACIKIHTKYATYLIPVCATSDDLEEHDERRNHLLAGRPRAWPERRRGGAKNLLSAFHLILINRDPTTHPLGLSTLEAVYCQVSRVKRIATTRKVSAFNERLPHSPRVLYRQSVSFEISQVLVLFCNAKMSSRRILTTLRRIGFGGVFVILSLLFDVPTCQAFQTTQNQIPASRRRFHPATILATSKENDECNTYAANSSDNPNNISFLRVPNTSTSRRGVLITMAAAASLFPLASMAQPTPATQPSLDDLELGQAQWTSLGPSGRSASSGLATPVSFCTYLARFLINYDEGVASWWHGQIQSVSLLSPDKQQRQLGQSFGNFAASLQQALDAYLPQKRRDGYSKLFQRLLETYRGIDSPRHIGILCALLPPEDQPQGSIRKSLFESSSTPPSTLQTEGSIAIVPPILMDDLSALLPSYYHISLTGDTVTLTPPLPLYQVGLDEEFGQTATGTPFGPLSSEVLTRELRTYTPVIYAVLGLSGAMGCALTHSLVIPLDVVKTKAQTEPNEYSNILQGASKIVRDEGWSGLLTGAEATLAGYFWYGLSVYPSYTFFKRYLGQSLFTADWALAHTNSIALLAGALAAVIASLGLTPLEAARIRVVADPITYKKLGLAGTLQTIASEDEGSWTRVYAGLQSLLIRQVIFGSIKFLAFERACDVIYSVSPSLRDATWTALGVSLVAGGFSGTLSSVVSQPADAVLTYVAQSSESLSFLEASKKMVEKGGPGSLFRGLGSRCLWAGSIIAGQFLLYDVFRTLFGVTASDLSEVFQVEI